MRVIDSSTHVDGATETDDQEGRRRQTISIDHVRGMIRDAALKPFEGTCRVFIIDGAHRMVESAHNAFLKTIEEPTDDTMIILTAPSTSALPLTVVSRCRVVELRPVATAVIAQTLVDRFGAQEDEAENLARLSRGRPGWAINALSDPTALDLHTQSVQRIVGAITGGLEDRFRYAREMSGNFWRNRDGVLQEMQRWLEWWRDVAMARAGLNEQVVNLDSLETLQALGRSLSADEIAAAVEAVTRTVQALEANAIPRLALEVMMLDLPYADLQGAASESGAADQAAESRR